MIQPRCLSRGLDETRSAYLSALSHRACGGQGYVVTRPAEGPPCN